MATLSGIAGGPIGFIGSILSGVLEVALIVEDGTNVTDSNSWQDYDTFVAYFENQPRSVSVYNQETVEAKLVAAAYILTWRYRWCGKKTYSTQTLSWPRTNGKGRDWEKIGNNEIPMFLKIAQAELAYWLLINQDKTGFESAKDEETQLYEEIDIFEGIRIEYKKTNRFRPLPEIISEIVAPCGNLTGSSGTFYIERAS